MVDQIRPAQLPDWLRDHAAGGKPLVLDVREPWEVQAASVKADDAYELLVIPMSQMPAALSQLNPQRATAVLCHHGSRSQRVAMYLEQQGFTQVANIAGGIDAWSNELDPAVPRY